MGEYLADCRGRIAALVPLGSHHGDVRASCP